jgi:predicted Rossmann-fold nucleotide-binding protein
MKGASVGHAKQRTRDARYIGLSEPGIIAAEPPNPMVSDLVILPDIEKRLEAFVRMAHGIIVFPGGVGTVEEILYLLGVLTDPRNSEQVLPVVFAGPADCADYFRSLDQFLKTVLGSAAEGLYEIIVGDARAVGRRMSQQIRRVTRQRVRDEDAYYFNWLLNVPLEHQLPFDVSHETVAALNLSKNLPVNELLVDLRRAFSAIVTGNVKDQGIRMIKKHGPFEITSDPVLLNALDDLLRGFTAQGRMKLQGEYKPCYVVKAA